MVVSIYLLLRTTQQSITDANKQYKARSLLFPPYMCVSNHEVKYLFHYNSNLWLLHPYTFLIIIVCLDYG
jgi:hypothetical protein